MGLILKLQDSPEPTLSISEIRRHESELSIINSSGRSIGIKFDYSIDQALIHDCKRVIVLLGGRKVSKVIKNSDGTKEIIKVDIEYKDRNVLAVDQLGNTIWRIPDSGATEKHFIFKVAQHYSDIYLDQNELKCFGATNIVANPWTGAILRKEERHRQVINFDTSKKSEILDPSDEFKSFLNQYFDDRMYWIRGEYDPNIPKSLKDKELEIAKQIVADNIDTGLPHLIWVAQAFDMYETVDRIKVLIKPGMDLFRELEISTALYKWVHYPSDDQYCDLLVRCFNSGGEYLREESLRLSILLKPNQVMALINRGFEDHRYGVRCQALSMYIQKRLEEYKKNGLRDVTYEMFQSYVSDSVFDDKALFLSRRKNLESKIDVEIEHLKNPVQIETKRQEGGKWLKLYSKATMPILMPLIRIVNRLDEKSPKSIEARIAHKVLLIALTIENIPYGRKEAPKSRNNDRLFGGFSEGETCNHCKTHQRTNSRCYKCEKRMDGKSELWLPFGTSADNYCGQCHPDRKGRFKDCWTSGPWFHKNYEQFTPLYYVSDLKRGYLYACIRCSAKWFMGESRTSIQHLDHEQLASLDEWINADRAVPESIKRVLLEIRPTQFSKHTRLDYISVPCKVRLMSGEERECCLINFSRGSRPHNQTNAIPINEIKEVLPSDYAYSYDVRLKISMRSEVRMGYEPTTLVAPDGKYYVVIDSPAFAYHHGYKGNQFALPNPDAKCDQEVIHMFSNTLEGQNILSVSADWDPDIGDATITPSEAVLTIRRYIKLYGLTGEKTIRLMEELELDQRTFKAAADRVYELKKWQNQILEGKN